MYQQNEGLICYTEGLTQFSSFGGGQQNTLIQITNWADIAAIGGFNPNQFMQTATDPFREREIGSPSEFAITI